jgi:hypothetical protein
MGTQSGRLFDAVLQFLKEVPMKSIPERRSARTLFLLILLLGSVWLYQHPGVVTADSWTWEEQLAMEKQMQQAAMANPGQVPEIDRNIPQTETALFALG